MKTNSHLKRLSFSWVKTWLNDAPAHTHALPAHGASYCPRQGAIGQSLFLMLVMLLNNWNMSFRNMAPQFSTSTSSEMGFELALQLTLALLTSHLHWMTVGCFCAVSNSLHSPLGVWGKLGYIGPYSSKLCTVKLDSLFVNFGVSVGLIWCTCSVWPNSHLVWMHVHLNVIFLQTGNLICS